MNGEPLRSVYTPDVPALLRAHGCCVLLTTYQANRLVILRTSDGEQLNTHFRAFDKPMGLAVDGDRLAIGTASSVWEFHNLPAVAQRLNSDDQQLNRDEQSGYAPHDACFLPRTTHWTGNIQIHEMAWADGELWMVNTRFSCLARRDPVFNFEPLWKPKFISSYAAGDRCHLNGIGLRDKQPRYVTAMAATDAAGQWRNHKRDGGIVIDICSDEIIASGLSMPHSPRWYADRLWVLNSGFGQFGYIDSQTGRFECVVRLPGFTRGLAFLGPYALVGLSQVRESAVFGGTEISDQSLDQRQCGVWLIDLSTGTIAGMVRFEDAIQEIFAIETFPASFPELVIDDSTSLIADSFELSDDFIRHAE
jgi:uncharacterized protein (TIGR03032 family)